MDIMRKYFLLIITVLLWHGMALAKNIEITVLNKNSQPMPYAFILVNGKALATSDTLGVAIITTSKLIDKDTISISYLGTSSQWILYDDSLKKSGKYCFYIEESSFMLNELLVILQDPEKLFRKSTKLIRQLNYNCLMYANFDANFKEVDKTVYHAAGSLEAANEVWSKNFSYRAHGWFHLPLKFATDSDTLKTGRRLNFNIHLALNYINSVLETCHTKSYGKYKPHYSYLGEKDNYKIFRISYPETYIGYSYQIILYVDKDTKYIRSLEFEAVNTILNRDIYINKFSINCDCELFTQKKPMMNTVMIPVNLRYNAQMFDGSHVDIKLSNISIKNK